MTVDEFTLWKLRVVREFIALTAPEVSLSCFLWSRAPGNAYITFYPTRWLPPPDDPVACSDRVLGAAIYRRATSEDDGPRRFTLADYGAGTLELAGWSTESKSENLAASDPARDRDPVAVARRVRDAIDVRRLVGEGSVDLAMSRVVIAWLDEVISAAGEFDATAVGMRFEEDTEPRKLWVIDVAGAEAGSGREVWWGNRAPRGES